VVYALLLLVPFAIYLHHLVPAVYGGDSGELAAAAWTLGLPHAPGYPLYCLLAKIAGTIFPFANPAFRAHLLAALIACALGALVVAVLRQHGLGKPAATGAAVVCMAAPIVYEQALVAEVFTLNAVIFFSIIWAIGLARDSDARGVYLAALLFGLGMANHQTLVLAVPGLFLYAWMRLGRQQVLTLVRRPVPYLFFFLGFSCYLYLLIRAQARPLIHFGDPDTLPRLWAVISRQEFGSFELHPAALRSHSMEAFIGQLLVYLSTIIRQFGYAGLAVCASGMWLARRKALFLPLLVVFFLAGPFFIFYSNLAPNALASWRLERFHLLPFCVLAVFTGFAFERLCQVRARLTGAGVGRAVFALALTACILLAGPRIANTRGNLALYDFGSNMLRGVALGGTLFLDTVLFDEYGSGLVFQRGCLNKRNDVTVYARSGTMFTSLYGDDFFDLSPSRRRERRHQAEASFAASLTGPFYCAAMNPAVSPVKGMAANGLIYARADGPSDIWRFYAQRELMPARSRPHDYPTRLVLAHYPYFEGKDMFARGEFEQAHRLFRESTLYGYDFEWLYYNIGSIYARANDISRAEEYLREALERDPFFPDTWFGLGYVALVKQEFGQAERFLEQCIELKPSYAQAYNNLAVAKQNLGKTGEVPALLHHYQRLQ